VPAYGSPLSHATESAPRCALRHRAVKLTWLALGGDHVDPSRGGEQAIALGRL